MIWLTRDMVEAFHRESLARFGGADGLRDPGLLESALARPENIHAYEPQADLFRLAASYCAGIVKNHPFVDGNKRVAAHATIVFLDLNDQEFLATPEELVEMTLAVAEGKVQAEALAIWFRQRLRSAE